MCDTCGCNITPGNEHLVVNDGKLAKTESGSEAVEVLQGLLHENDHQAAHNRHHFDSRQVLAINLMSSPGTGKTALLEATIDALGDQLRIGVVEGDLETENDADRIRAKGVPACQISTGSACHLDAHMVHDALHHMDLDSLDILFIENVGNLVCPASFDLGHHRNITLLSVTEGDDKPAKYPVIFRAADLVLLTKTDLLPYLEEFNPARAEEALRNLSNPAEMISLSAKSSEGIERWIEWLQHEVQHYRRHLESGATLTPALQPEGRAIHQHHHDHHHN